MNRSIRPIHITACAALVLTACVVEAELPTEDAATARVAAPVCQQTEIDISLELPCAETYYAETYRLTGTGSTYAECKSDAVADFKSAARQRCADTAWDEGACLDLDTCGPSGQCVGNPDRTVAFGSGANCTYSKANDGTYACTCKEVVACGCQCEDCDPDG